MTSVVCVFPNGDELFIVHPKGDVTYHVGEKVFFVGERDYRISDIQHQLIRPFEYQMTIIILEEIIP